MRGLIWVIGLAALAVALAARLPPGFTAVVGHPLQEGEARYNAVSVLHDGAVTAVYRKQKLPNHSVFDEVRTFQAGTAACVVECAGVRFGILVCADIWETGPATQARDAGAQVLLVANASPYHMNKETERRVAARDRVAETGLPLLYANMVGGQDELVFDGASFCLDHAGQVACQCPAFVEGLYLVELNDGAIHGDMTPLPNLEASVYQALVLGVRDYVRKNKFPGVLLGLSGGIDSALTLVVAVDALGAGKVRAVMMPSEFTADISLEDAEQLAENLGVKYDVQPIKRMYDAFLEELSDEFDDLPFDQTEENIQARIRGVLLMALSNKFGPLVLTAGNKSEVASGYATLYGDMAGGFAVLKDLYKTLVFRLSNWRNTVSPVIPQNIIDRPPSAELKPDQKDQDSLPPYEMLDAIIEAYMERDQSPREIIAAGFPEAEVRRTVSMLKRNEYKRRQAPVGIRVTPRGFGRDWRYPITSRYQDEF